MTDPSPKNREPAIREALLAIRQSVKNARGAIESNQVVDKDVHGTLTGVIAKIDAALDDAHAIPPANTRERGLSPTERTEE